MTVIIKIRRWKLRNGRADPLIKACYFQKRFGIGPVKADKTGGLAFGQPPADVGQTDCVKRQREKHGL